MNHKSGVYRQAGETPTHKKVRNVLKTLMGIFLCLGLSAFLAACGNGSGAGNAGEIAASEQRGWTGAWATAPYGPYPLGPVTPTLPVDPFAVSTLTLFTNKQAVDQSFRMVIHPTIGGKIVRIRLSNLMGDRPVTFTSAQIAHRAVGPAIVPGSAVGLSFAGKPDVTIAPGQEAVSDAAAFVFSHGDDLAVSFHVVGESGPMTWHAISFVGNYVGLPGTDTTGDPTGLSFATQPTAGWFFLNGLDVKASDSIGAIVAIGDSITDGFLQIPESNTRWPDDLAQRLAAANVQMGVLNQGINSNTVTTEGTPAGQEYKGPPAILRFQRDVLDRPGVRSVIIFEGTNDLTMGIKAAVIHAGILSLVDRAHAAGLCVVVGTIMPRDDQTYGWDKATMEPERVALNALLRATKGVEGLADFDQVMGSPIDPTLPNPVLYFADLLHPNTLGFQVMADAVPMEALLPAPVGHCARHPR